MLETFASQTPARAAQHGSKGSSKGSCHQMNKSFRTLKNASDSISNLLARTPAKIQLFRHKISNCVAGTIKPIFTQISEVGLNLVDAGCLKRTSLVFFDWKFLGFAHLRLLQG